MKKLSRVTLNVFDYIGTAMQTGKAYWVSTRRSRSGVEGVLGASVRRGSIGSPLARGELKVGVRPREKPLVGRPAWLAIALAGRLAARLPQWCGRAPRCPGGAGDENPPWLRRARRGYGVTQQGLHGWICKPQSCGSWWLRGNERQRG